MISALYPPIQEYQRPIAVSYEASFVRMNIETCHSIFMGQSVFANNLFKQQLKKRFDFFKEVWKSETLFSSSISEIINNTAYRSIIGLGQGVIPFIIEDLTLNDNHWFYALEALTGNNPIKESHKGFVPLMKNDWIEWAEQNNLIYEG